MASKVVVIHGPQACGKTRNAPALARHYGVERIVDDWNGRARLPAAALVLTNADAFSPPAGARVVGFDVAMREAGLSQ